MKYLLQYKVFGCKARLSKGKIVSSGVLIRMASWSNIESPPFCSKNREILEKNRVTTKIKITKLKRIKGKSPGVGKEKELKARAGNDSWKQWGPRAYWVDFYGIRNEALDPCWMAAWPEWRLLFKAKLLKKAVKQELEKFHILSRESDEKVYCV